MAAVYRESARAISCKFEGEWVQETGEEAIVIVEKEQVFCFEIALCGD